MKRGVPQRRRELATVFAELSRPQGPRIVLEPALEYLAMSQSVRFGELERVAAASGEIALGLRRAGPSGTGLALNPDRETEWTLASCDDVVLLRSYTEPEVGA